MSYTPRFPRRRVSNLVTVLIVLTCLMAGTSDAQTNSYQALTTLFSEWREFERPSGRGRAPDYGAATMAQKHAALKNRFVRLSAIIGGTWRRCATSMIQTNQLRTTFCESYRSRRARNSRFASITMESIAPA
jgi:hypothetical protein